MLHNYISIQQTVEHWSSLHASVCSGADVNTRLHKSNERGME